MANLRSAALLLGVLSGGVVGAENGNLTNQQAVRAAGPQNTIICTYHGMRGSNWTLTVRGRSCPQIATK